MPENRFARLIFLILRGISCASINIGRSNSEIIRAIENVNIIDTTGLTSFGIDFWLTWYTTLETINSMAEPMINIMLLLKFLIPPFMYNAINEEGLFNDYCL
jgi:hypothetical protein